MPAAGIYSVDIRKVKKYFSNEGTVQLFILPRFVRLIPTVLLLIIPTIY